MTDTMKSIAIHLLFKPFIRAWVHHSRQWNVTMKSRVEYCYLWNVWQDALNNFDALEICGVMQGCENGHT